MCRRCAFDLYEVGHTHGDKGCDEKRICCTVFVSRARNVYACVLGNFRSMEGSGGFTLMGLFAVIKEARNDGGTMIDGARKYRKAAAMNLRSNNGIMEDGIQE